MKKPAVTSGGLSGEVLTAGSQSVPGTADLVVTRHARSIRLHHVLVRRRRWSKELDELLGPARGWWS